MAQMPPAVTVLLSLCKKHRQPIFPQKPFGAIAHLQVHARLFSLQGLYRRECLGRGTLWHEKENRASNRTREKVHPGFLCQTVGIVSPDKPEGHENHSLTKINLSMNLKKSSCPEIYFS